MLAVDHLYGRLTTGTSGVFVTGTGTGVGKTVVAAAIARTLVTRGKRVGVFKPAVTGLDEFAPGGPAAGLPPHIAGRELARRPDHEAGGSSTHRPDHEVLRAATGSGQSDEEVAPYRFGPPMSPHLAAELAGEEISRERLLEAARAAADEGDVLVCEGVGGLLVPLAPRYSVRDLAVDLALPLVVAASPGLGTINHTLLTIGAARAAGLDVAAAVLTPWPEEPDEIERSNRETIAALGEIQVEALPRLDLDEPETWPDLGVVSL